MSRRSQISYAWLITIIVVGLALVFEGRLVYLQVFHHETYKALAKGQYSVPVGSIFNRGSIYFKDKSGGVSLAAGLGSGFLLAINTKQIGDPSAVYAAINAIIPLDEKEFLAKALKKDDPYEEISRRVPEEKASLLKKAKIPGVVLSPERWRVYPHKTLSAQTLGFVAYGENDTLSGRYGLERYYNDVLARDSESVYVNFFAEVFSDLSKNVFANARERDGDLVLTIEPKVEEYVEGALEEVKARWQSDLVGAIVLDPSDGKILAMVSLPSFDLNSFGEQINAPHYKNPLVENVYEMGSIIKPLTLAAGIDAGAVTPDTHYEDRGFVEVSGKRLKNFDEKGRGYVDMLRVLGESLNTGLVFVAQKLGHEKFKNYMYGYGLGEETGIDLPNEVAGLVKNLDSRVEVDYLTAAFGQGVAMSPLATARALASLGNGGKLINPYVVGEIRYKGGFSKKLVPNESKQVLKKETSETITRMLVNVVDKYLAGGGHNIPRYSVAAKTGTAQMAAPGGGYYEDRFLHSFFGYFPAYNPKFLVFLFQVHPKGARFSSETLTDPFLKITKFLLNYYEIPPDR